MAQLKGKGFYYNEISGALSGADLSLSSLTKISSTANQTER